MGYASDMKEKKTTGKMDQEKVDGSKRRLVKAAYTAPVLFALGPVTAGDLGSPCGPPGECGQSLEPEPNLEDTQSCHDWLSPDCID